MPEEKLLLLVVGPAASLLLKSKPSLGIVMAELAGIGFCVFVCWIVNQWMPNSGAVPVVEYSQFMLLGYVPGRVVVWLGNNLLSRP